MNRYKLVLADQHRVKSMRRQCQSVQEAIHPTPWGYSEEYRQLINRRGAATHAAYLIPHLEPGLTMVDFGSGLGTIPV